MQIETPQVFICNFTQEDATNPDGKAATMHNKSGKLISYIG